MLPFVLKRLMNAAVVMLAVAFIAFMSFRFVGDPVELMLNEQASQAQRDELRVRLGLDRPFPLQFVRFIRNALGGDLGISYRNQREVAELIVERMPATLELVALSTLLSLAIGIPLGVYSAIHRDRIATKLLQFISVLGVSLPSFAIGILLILVFAIVLKWLPPFGRGDVVKIGWWTTGLLTPSGRKALVLPTLTLSLFQITLVMRLVRAEMLETMRADFIRFARARGLKPATIHFRHALRNCLMPVITVTGLQIGNLIAFALVTETVFQWPGMGALFVQAVTFVDIPVMAAYLMVISLIFVLINMVVDWLYAVVDPRLRDNSATRGADER